MEERGREMAGSEEMGEPMEEHGELRARVYLIFRE